MTVFVGRQKELAETLELVRAGGDALIVAVVGMHGIGKTALLDEILNVGAGVKGLTCAPKVDLSALVVGPEEGEGETAGALWRAFDRSRTVMTDWATWTGGVEEFAPFRRVVRDASSEVNAVVTGNAISASDKAKVERVEMTSHVYYDEENVKDTIRRSQTRIDDAFVGGWDAWSARHRMLVVVDHFDLVARGRFGQWILGTTLRLQNLVAVISCLPITAPLLPATERMRIKHLELFTLDEVRTYLTRYFDPIPIGEAIAEVTHRFTDGHPGGVKLVANLVSERDAVPIDAAELRRLLDRLPEEPWAQWAQLVRLILGPLKEDLRVEAAEACSVVNAFDEPLLAALVGDTSGGVGDVVGMLHGFGLVRHLNASGLRDASLFRMREFIRQALARDLRTSHPRSWEQYHRRAASHYAERLEGMEDEASDAYGSWYRYENPAWQRAKSEWLFHTSQLPASEELTRARFVTVFLEAFYWYGCYEPFLFNRRLLWDWTRSSPDEDLASSVPLPGKAKDEQLLDALAFVLDHYPIGYTKPSDRWDEIRDRLLLVERLCGLGRGGKLRGSPERDASRAFALLRVFLAHTQRYRTPQGEDAERYYRDGLAGFEQLGDRWMVAWVLFELADLALDQGRQEQAAELLGDSAEKLQELVADGDDWDEELVSDLLRARGDAHWLAGEIDEAFACYGKAVLHAYRFQGVPHEPDEYTQRFYAEVTTRAASRLVERRDDASALPHALALYSVLNPGQPNPHGFEALLASEPAKGLAEAVFPPGPGMDELRTEESAFMTRWRRFEDEAPDTAGDVAFLLTQARDRAS